jgi:hypothetical protein
LGGIVALHVETGDLTPAPDPVQPYDPAMSPGVAPPTQTAGLLTPADQGGVFGAAADQAARLSGYESDIAAAQSAGQDARNAMLAHYSQDILPQGSSYGDPMDLPEVPAYTVPPASSSLYPFSGDEPVPGI